MPQKHKPARRTVPALHIAGGLTGYNRVLKKGGIKNDRLAYRSMEQHRAQRFHDDLR